MGQKESKALHEPLLDQQDVQITVSHIYKLNCKDLKQLFSDKAGVDLALQFLKDHQGTRGILQKVSSDARTGIVGDEKDLIRRKKHFGTNSKPLAEPPKLKDSVKQTLQEVIWWALAGSALVAGIVEAFSQGWSNITEAIYIMLMTLFLVTATSYADLVKDKRFIQLQSLILDETVPVIRGKQGSTNNISVWDLVVGDVIILEAGSKVPADCLVLEASELKVSGPDDDDKGNDIAKEKTPYNERGMQCDPILFAGSKITKGSGKALICCVGPTSSMKQVVKAEEQGTNEDTPLQSKLHNLEQQFTLGALGSAALIFLILLIRLILDTFVFKNDEGESLAGVGDFVNKITTFINITVVLIVVSVPDGLPITIGISLAFSVMKMFKQKILVRKLDAPEKMGGIQEICVGKTGTLTKNDMKVVQFYCENRLIINNRKDTLTHCDLQQDTLLRIQESILYNCDARVQMSGSIYKAVGDGTEVGLLNFLQEADIPIHLLINKKHGQIRMRSPFSPENKRSAVAIESPDRIGPDGKGMVSIYVKGAPELLLKFCSKLSMGSVDRTLELGEQERIDINQHITNMASQALRVIGFAYIELNYDEWQRNFANDETRALSEIFDEKIRSNDPFFTWIGAFGVKDQLRPGVVESIKYARDDCQLGIKLISGDHYETARAVAKKCGIIREREETPNAIMDGAAFQRLVGPPLYYKSDQNSNAQIETDELQNMDAFRKVIGELKVLARATPLHKEILVRGMKACNCSVGVTGEGIEDVHCLNSADVGLAMGSGCSAVKSASDLILTDDDFQANIQAIMWGRNIYHNVARFLQYQATVNVACLLTVIIGGMILTDSPFSASQLLWINLIMDTFAAVALSTEPPIKTVTTGPPINSDHNLVTTAVKRQVLGMALWHTIIMGIMFASMTLRRNELGEKLYDASVAIDFTGELGSDEDNAAKYKIKCLRDIYNTFMFLQIFNLINCRKVGSKDFNVFEDFFHNFYFLLVFFGTFIFQIMTNQNGILRKILKVNLKDSEGNLIYMDKQELGKCIAIGSTSLIVSALLKMISVGQVEKYAGPLNFVDENRETNNQVLSSFKKVNEIKVAIPGEDKDQDNGEDQKAAGDAVDEEYPTHN